MQNLNIENMSRSSITLDNMVLSFYRTTRVPAGRINSLPAGLGNFPVYKVSDFKSGVPDDWQDEGYFFPMYKSEAMWMGFARNYHDPSALIVAAGNINAISGKPFEPKKNLYDKSRKKRKDEFDIRLEQDQNYLIIPPQPWIDGWKAEDGKVYQFVAAEMGSGETVEGQITGEEKFGGIQLILYKPKPGIDLTPQSTPHEYIEGGWPSLGFGYNMFDEFGSDHIMSLCADTSDYCMKSHGSKKNLSESLRSVSVQSMGLGRGGEISQHIYLDPYGPEVWNPDPVSLTRLYLVSSADFKQITGHDAPPTPVTYKKYQELGMPWFELYDDKLGDAKGSGVFDKLKEVSDGPTLIQKNASYDKKKKFKIDVKKFELFK